MQKGQFLCSFDLCDDGFQPQFAGHQDNGLYNGRIAPLVKGYGH